MNVAKNIKKSSFSSQSNDIFSIKVIPRAKKTEVVGKMADGTLKIRVSAIPEKWRANKEIEEFFSKEYGWEWEIFSGKTASRKIIRKKNLP